MANITEDGYNYGRIHKGVIGGGSALGQKGLKIETCVEL